MQIIDEYLELHFFSEITQPMSLHKYLPIKRSFLNKVEIRRNIKKLK